jgi:hypothetical protein
VAVGLNSQAGRLPNKSMRNFVKNLVLAGLLLVMVLPQAPIQLRFLLVLLAISIPYAATELKHKVLQWQLMFTAYAILVGACFLFAFEDGTWDMVLGPLRDMIIAALAVIAFRGRSPGVFLAFASAWTLVEFSALVDEHLQGALWARLPFPIAKPADMELLNAGSGWRESIGRYGGLTFESSIVGGMAGLFAVVALLMLFAPGRTHQRAWKFNWTVLAWFTVAGALAINLLAQTKSGVFIIAGFLLPYLGSQALTGNLLRFRHLKRISLVVAGITGAGLLTWAFAHSENLENYIADEIDHAASVADFGIMDNDLGGGLVTRLAYFELTFQAFPYHPFGVGSTSGFTFVKPVLNKAKITSEMDYYFSQNQYVMTSPFCLAIMYAGVFGLLFGWLMFRAGSRIMCPVSSKYDKAWVSAGLIAYFVYINAVGVSPYLAMFIILIEAGSACNRDLRISPADDEVPNRPRSRQLSPSYAKANPPAGDLPVER